MLAGVTLGGFGAANRAHERLLPGTVAILTHLTCRTAAELQVSGAGMSIFGSNQSDAADMKQTIQLHSSLRHARGVRRGVRYRRAGRPDRIGAQKPRKAGGVCARCITRCEIQIREMPVRLPADPVVAWRAICH